MKKLNSSPSSHPLVAFSILIILAVLIAVNILICFKMQKKISIPQPKTTTESMSDWQTYSNENFSFRYPSKGWSVEELDNVVWFGPTGKWCEPTCYTGFSVESTTTTVSNFIKEYNSSSEWSQILEETPYTLNNISGTRLIGSTEIGIDEHYFFFEKDSQSYILNYKDSLKPLEKQILSTFRVIDDMTDWQTYTNTKMGFSLDHPVGWKIDDSSTPNKVWFDPKETEAVDSVEIFDKTLELWLSKFYEDEIIAKRDLIVDGYPAVQIDLNGFGAQETAISKDDKLYIVVSNRHIKNLDILSTFKFIK